MSNEDTYDIAPPDPPSPYPERSQLHQPKRVVTRCPKCKYDLTGSHPERCPECGLRLTVAVITRAQQNTFRDIYLEPLAWLVGGLVVTLGIMLLRGGGVEGVVGTIIGLGAAIVIGWIVFVVCSVIWIGFDQPLPTTAVQLAGAYSGFFAVWSLTSLVQLGFIFIVFLIIPLFVLVGLMSHLLDLDLADAVWVSLLSGAAIIAFLIFMATAL